MGILLTSSFLVLGCLQSQTSLCLEVDINRRAESRRWVGCTRSLSAHKSQKYRQK